MPTGTHTARAAADAAKALEAVARSPRPAALVGFDGFVDSIVHMVATRRDMTPAGYERIRTISEFAARCAAAAGRSTNIERVQVEDRFGGNGPLLAGALATLGVPTTYIGAVGAGGRVEPIFEPFARRCRKVVSLGPPSHTLCLEFDDGKLMFNDAANVQRVTWDAIVGAVGLDALRRVVGEASLLGIVNWSLLGGVPGIWRGLLRDVLPKVAPKPRTLFIDLSDPAKRTDADLAGAMAQLAELQGAGLQVILGLNLAEASRVGGPAIAQSLRGEPAGDAIQTAAIAIRERLAIECVVIHPRHGAAGATRAGAAAWFDAPLAVAPRLSTGAGDHFNAGFAFAWSMGLPLEACLGVGCAASGVYVREASSPDIARLVAFLRAMAESEPA